MLWVETFNSELLAAPDALRREVMVEELLHLRLPNHGTLFRSLKRAYLAGSSQGTQLAANQNSKCSLGR